MDTASKFSDKGLVSKRPLKHPNPSTKDKLVGQAKLIAAITAAYTGEDVNVAANVAAEAVRWNGTAQIFIIMSLRK